MEVSEFQKIIYNDHLAIYKRVQKKPYTIKKDFNDFDKTKPHEFNSLLKLETFFINHSNVNRRLFLESPYMLYKDKNYFDLSFYTTQAAIKCYTTYLKQLDLMNPDNDEQIQYIKDSLRFIMDFCLQQKIKLIDYPEFKEQVMYSWCVHMAQNMISPYVILGFNYFGKDIISIASNMSIEEREMVIPQFCDYSIYNDYMRKLDASTVAKEIITQYLPLIQKKTLANISKPANITTVN